MASSSHSLDELELALVQARDCDVLQRDRVRRNRRNNRVCADLLRRADKMRPIGKDCALDLHVIGAIESGRT